MKLSSTAVSLELTKSDLNIMNLVGLDTVDSLIIGQT